jgi:ATP-dependent RNA helicase RhlE
LKFVDLKIITPIQKAVDAAGYLTPTPIQEKAIPIVLEGRDLFGCAQTGTGKTAAFGIPILQMLYLDGMSRKEHRKIRALILTPTRELAIQIKESFTLLGKFTGLKSAVIYGGVPQSSQTTALRLGVDIVVATPGRLLDLIEQGFVVLDSVKTLVLDEADRMLDMGFSPDVKRILALLPITRQTLMFSATIPPEIIKLTKSILRNPSQV